MLAEATDPTLEEEVHYLYDNYALPPHVASIVGTWSACLTAVAAITTFLTASHALLLTLMPTFPPHEHEPISYTVARYFSWIGIQASLIGTLASLFMLDAMASITLRAKSFCEKSARDHMADENSPSSLRLAERLYRDPDSKDDRAKMLALCEGYDTRKQITFEEAKRRYKKALGEMMRPRHADLLKEFGLETNWRWQRWMYYSMPPISIVCAVIHLQIYIWKEDSKWNAGCQMPMFLLALITCLAGYFHGVI